MRNLFLPLLLCSALATSTAAQNAQSGDSSSTQLSGGGDRTTAVRCDECPPTFGGKRLGPGEKVTDSNGVTVTNNGSSGDLSISGTGSMREQPRGSGCWSVSGSITDITNPRSGGTSSGPIDIDTNGQPVNINLQRTGSSSSAPVVTNVTGGNATVNIGGNSGSSTQNNQVNVGGTGNTVNFGSRSANNTGNGGTGAGATAGTGSGGTVNSGGSNNQFNSRGGSWSFRT